MQETKAAVESGAWPLYRWDPRLEDEGRCPFLLDSDKLQQELTAFLDRQNQLTLLANSEPNLQTGLCRSSSTMAELHEELLLSAARLTKGLNGPPLLILYASDGGNAEECARMLEMAAKAGGLNARRLAMDDFEVDQLAAEVNVAFCISTAGQGEFPMNGRTFWKSVCSISEANALEAIRYAVFGLGDSHYWPRPEDARYFCKPSVDLDKKLAELGAARMIDLGKGDDQDDDGYKTEFAKWCSELWSALQIDASAATAAAADDPNKLPSDEVIKEESDYLRGTIAEGLNDTSTASLPLRDTKITKFHGIYQQDNRDVREARRKQGLEKAYSFMIRVGIPGGVCSPQQWLDIDGLAEEYANSQFKLTTRQAFQLHGVIKSHLKSTIQGINRGLMTTLAACGDVCRNVIANPLPFQSSVHAQVWNFACELSQHFSPKTTAYHEIWLNKKLVAGGPHKDVEPLYGKTYLPRKFKVAIAVPPMNDVDVLAHCLGYIAIIENNTLLGYTVTVGGGMGMTHNNMSTYPRLADPLCFCQVDQAIAVGEAVMTIQRDKGDRVNRKHARLKYTIEDVGMEWFRREVERRCGFVLEEPRPFQFSSNDDRYGWIQGVDNSWHYGLYIEHGRIRDTDTLKLRSALRDIARIHKGDFRLSANQHLYISNIAPSDLDSIKGLLARYGLNKRYTGLRTHSMACVALPTCGLALAESQCYLPSLVDKLDSVVEEAGLGNDGVRQRQME